MIPSNLPYTMMMMTMMVMMAMLVMPMLQPILCHHQTLDCFQFHLQMLMQSMHQLTNLFTRLNNLCWGSTPTNQMIATPATTKDPPVITSNNLVILHQPAAFHHPFTPPPQQAPPAPLHNATSCNNLLPGVLNITHAAILSATKLQMIPHLDAPPNICRLLNIRCKPHSSHCFMRALHLLKEPDYYPP